MIGATGGSACCTDAARPCAWAPQSAGTAAGAYACTGLAQALLRCMAASQLGPQGSCPELASSAPKAGYGGGKHPPLRKSSSRLTSPESLPRVLSSSYPYHS